MSLFVTMDIGSMNDVLDVKDPNHERQLLAGNRRLLLQLYDSSLLITPKGRKYGFELGLLRHR
jgi:hypothetical protein